MKNLKYFDLCKKLSNKSNHPDHKLGAIVLYKKRVLGLGFNQLKTNPKSKAFNRTIHAEFDAILNTGLSNLSGCSIYVYRETKNGVLGMSRPCLSCMELIKKVGIDKIYYTGNMSYHEEIV